MTWLQIVSKYKWYLAISFYFLMFGPFIYGIYNCYDSFCTEWVCPSTSTCDGDNGTGTNVWGPCGEIYSTQTDDTHSSAVIDPTPRPTRRPTINPTFRPTQIPTNAPTRVPTNRPTTRSPTRSPTTRSPTRSPTIDPDSTCDTVCGNEGVIACAMRDYSCDTGDYTSYYYCRDAINTISNPVAYGLLVGSVVIIGIMTFPGIVVLFCFAVKYSQRNNSRNAARNISERNTPFHLNPVSNTSFRITASHFMTPPARLFDPEADPRVLASDIPMARKAGFVTSDSLPAVIIN